MTLSEEGPISPSAARIVCVVGMHRSGTSMVTRLLNLSGVQLGDPADLAAPATDNPTGFWENSRFVRLNEDILSHLGAGWDHPPRRSANWAPDGPLARYHAEAARLAESFSQLPVWGWKDPRTSLTLPFWLHRFPRLKVIVCLRNPLDVARSLHARNYLSYALALRLWLQYNQRILHETCPDQRIVTHYDAYFRDPRSELERLLRFLGLPFDDESLGAAASTALAGLRHSQTRTADLIDSGVSEPILTTYRQLCREAEFAESIPHPTRAFTHLPTPPPPEPSILGPTIETADDDDPPGPEIGSLATPTLALYEAHHEIAALTRLLNERDRHLNQLTTDLTERDRHLAQAEKTIRTLQVQLTDAQSALAAVSVQAAEHAREIEAIKSSTGWSLLVVLWRLRVLLVPLGSRRDHALWKVLCTYRGWVAHLPRRAPRPVAPRPATDDLTASGHLLADCHGSLVDLDHVSRNEIAAPSTFDIIILPIIDWNFRFQRPQQLARQLARAGHRVFYIATTFQAGNWPRIRHIEPSIFEVQLAGPSHVSIYQDFLTPDLTSRFADSFAAIRATCSIGDAVCLINLPSWAALAFALRDRFAWKVVYDCLDEHSGFNTLAPAILNQEPALCRSSDLVVVSSRVLFAKQAPFNPNTLLLPNAADFDHFNAAARETPDDIRRLAKPIIGYYGAIAEWFDSDLVAHLARAQPSWSFVLIGSTRGADLEPLESLPNAHLLGEKPYVSLPAYLQAFDVGIIPFKRTQLTQATNPVKMFEYLSAGKPIVATALEELTTYRDQIALAATPAEWNQALDQALRAPDPGAVQRRVHFARANTWRERAGQLRDHLSRLYPMVSIIIVTYNNLSYTQFCLESVAQKTSYPNVEVILVDNGSSDGTPDYLADLAKSRSNVRIILNESNLGFAAANNLGIQAAQGEYICLLNNDTIVTPGWLSRLLFHLSDPSVGLVGPVTNSSGNESRIDVTYQSPADLDDFARRYTQAHFAQTFDIRMLAMFCVLMRRSLIDEIGLLDTRFGIGLFEDDDFSLRVRERGYRILCAEDVFVHHWGRASFSQMPDADYQRLFEENRRRFEEKWGLSWEPHQPRRPVQT